MIVVIGANGQLGQSFRKVLEDETLFLTSKDLDITNKESIENIFKNLSQDSIIINCSAYTSVDLAEDEQEKCFLVNSTGVKYLANLCKKYQLKLIHFSTDYVYQGTNSRPYTELDQTSPQSIYGKSKREGEIEISKKLDTFLIIRTSWLYSEFNNNFLKTMIKLGKEKDLLNVVSDQIGTPTYAHDLALATLKIIPQFKIGTREILNFSNEGVASWYDFAVEIMDQTQIDCKVSPILSENYPQKAKRPFYSLLDKSKIKNIFGIEIPHWKESLKLCLKNLS